MSDPANLATVADVLNAIVKQGRLPVVVELSEDARMLTALPEGWMPHAKSDVQKNPRRDAPEGKSFELYVQLRPTADRAADQRFILPGQVATRLRLNDEERVGLWILTVTFGEEAVVRLVLGNSMTADEANELLARVEQALASLRVGAKP